MAKKGKQTAETGKQDRYSDFPIRILGKVCMAAAFITFIVSAINSGDLWAAAFHAFIVGISFLIIGALVLVTYISVMSRILQERAEEMKRRLEEEQREFFESQVRLHDAMEDIGRERQESGDAGADQRDAASANR